MRKIIIAVMVTAILGGSFFLMWYFSSLKEEPAQQELPDIMRRVQTARVEYSGVNSSITAAGRLGSMRYVDVITEVQGEILKGGVPLKKGQRFKKGDLLVRIYDKEMDYNLKAAKSRFLNSIANILPDFRFDFPDEYPLVKKFFDDIQIDKPLPELPQIDSEKVRIFLASRNILNDYYSIKSTEIRLSKHWIYAQFSGTITDVMLEVGSIANPGSRIATIISTERLELEVPVEIEDIPWIKVNQEVDVLSEDGSMIWDGTVLRVSDFVDPNTQSVSVFVKVTPSANQPLYEGQYLRARFNGKLIEGAMEIPRRAVFNANEVYVVENDLLKKARVNVIKVNQETLVFDGLEEGTILVTQPLVGATEGSKVEISLIN
jgi:multidrug efflux pump subunit AcrA (membrane-fusion protein)